MITFEGLSVILFIFGGICTIYGFVRKDDLLNSVLGGFLVGLAFQCSIASKRPTAMDVYQGKTTLEITYKNGVPVDSVVVIKNK